MIDLRDIELAYTRIVSYINKTPIMASRTINRLTGCSVFFKCENFQRGGAFKFRGAMNSMLQLSPDERERGVITHSSGNHAQAVALAGSILNIKTVIVMPRSASPVKIAATRGYGAEVVLCEPTLQSRETTTQEIIEKHGYTFIHPYDNPKVIAGAGTTAFELLNKLGPLDALFAPIGGGGLMSGCSIVAKRRSTNTKVIGVEPAGADDAFRSFQKGKLIPSINPTTIADGLLTSMSELTFSIIRKNVDAIVTVNDREIIDAMRLLWERMKIVVEPSGAVSLAGLLKVSETMDNQKVGVILSGGNVPLDSFFDTITPLDQ